MRKKWGVADIFENLKGVATEKRLGTTALAQHSVEKNELHVMQTRACRRVQWRIYYDANDA